MNMNMATLFQFGNDGSRTLRSEIGEEPVVVGRSPQAKVSVADDGVSRRHFVILREGEGYVIRDLSSRNGTWVDGRRVSAERLHHNDCILAGHTLFLFADRLAASAAPGESRAGPHGTVVLSPLKPVLA